MGLRDGTYTGARVQHGQGPDGLSRDLPYDDTVVARITGGAMATRRAGLLRVIAMILIALAAGLVYVVAQEVPPPAELSWARITGFLDPVTLGAGFAFALVGGFVVALRSACIENGIARQSSGIVGGLPGMLKAIPMILLVVPLFVALDQLARWPTLVRLLLSLPIPLSGYEARMAARAVLSLVSFFIGMRLFFCIAAAARSDMGFGEALGEGLRTGFGRLSLVLVDYVLVGIVIAIIVGGYPFLLSRLGQFGLPSEAEIALEVVAAVILTFLVSQLMLLLAGHYWAHQLRRGTVRPRYT